MVRCDVYIFKLIASAQYFYWEVYDHNLLTHRLCYNSNAA